MTDAEIRVLCHLMDGYATHAWKAAEELDMHIDVYQGCLRALRDRGYARLASLFTDCMTTNGRGYMLTEEGRKKQREIEALMDSSTRDDNKLTRKLTQLFDA